MRIVAVIAITIMVTACGTVGGTLSGMGSDMQRAGDWVKNR